MGHFQKIPLRKILSEFGEDKTRKSLSEFSCPLNSDIEFFLKNSAIELEKQCVSRTNLLCITDNNKIVLAGYYTLTLKVLIADDMGVSKTTSKRIGKFCTHSDPFDLNILPAPLIAQLGKNYSNSYNKLISGDEIIETAIEDIQTASLLLGGRVVYIECADKPQLVSFYERNGFIKFGERFETPNGTLLIQMLKYINQKQ